MKTDIRVITAAAGLAILTSLAGCTTPEGQFAVVKNTDTPAAYEAFLQSYGTTEFAAEARARLEELRWRDAVNRDTPDAYAVYLQTYPLSARLDEAKQRKATAERREKLTKCEKWFEKAKKMKNYSPLAKLASTAQADPDLEPIAQRISELLTNRFEVVTASETLVVWEHAPADGQGEPELECTVDCGVRNAQSMFSMFGLGSEPNEPEVRGPVCVLELYELPGDSTFILKKGMLTYWKNPVMSLTAGQPHGWTYRDANGALLRTNFQIAFDGKGDLPLLGYVSFAAATTTTHFYTQAISEPPSKPALLTGHLNVPPTDWVTLKPGLDVSDCQLQIQRGKLTLLPGARIARAREGWK